MKNTFYLNSSCTGSKTELTSGCAGAGASSAGVLASTGVNPLPGRRRTAPCNLCSPMSRIWPPRGVSWLWSLTEIGKTSEVEKNTLIFTSGLNIHDQPFSEC